MKQAVLVPGTGEASPQAQLPGPQQPARPDVPAGRGTRGRTLERRLRRVLTRLLVWALRPRPVAAPALATAEIGHLLVIRQHNQMGDMVLALPALRALRAAWPRARLTFVTGPLCEGLLRQHPDIDRLVVYRKQRMWRPWRLLRFVGDLRRPRPDLALVLGTVSFSVTSALLAWASGARIRVGVTSLPFGSELSRALYHIELPLAPAGLHEVEHNLVPLRSLGIPAPIVLPVLVPPAAAVERARRFLADAFPGVAGPVVVVHAGAGKDANMWPVQHFAALAAALTAAPLAGTPGAASAVRLVCSEGPRDAGPVAELLSRLPGAVRWRASLGETLGLLALADLFIAGDTGMAHVAAAVGAPTLAVFGPTDARRWAPAGKRVRCVVSATGSIAGARVEDAIRAARELLCADE